MRRARRRRRGQEGQAAVELALALPLVAVLFLLLAQAALLARDVVAVSHAAREAAREAAVRGGDRPGRFAAAAAPLRADRLDVRVTRGRVGELATVVVRYRAPTDVPVVGPLVPDVTLAVTARSRVEQTLATPRGGNSTQRGE